MRARETSCLMMSLYTRVRGIGAVGLPDEIEDVELGGRNGSSGDDAGPGEEVALEVPVSAVEGLSELLLRLDLLCEHLHRRPAERAGDVVTGKSARLGEVHLRDVRQRDQLGGQGRGDDIIEGDCEAGRLEGPAATKNLRIRGVLADL